MRTVAVLMVFVYHAHEPWLPGGNIGVDVFFVISGFVITSLLMRGINKEGRLHLGRFYFDRLRRLAPALVVMVAVVGSYLLTEGRINDAAKGVFALTYTTNLIRLVPSISESVFSHTWSLAVEEQFYLGWPLLLTLGIRRWRPSRAAVVIGFAGTALAALLAVVTVLTFGDTSQVQAFVYNSPFTRASQLLLGCGLAGLVESGAIRGWKSNVTSCVGAVGLVAWSILVGFGPYQDLLWFSFLVVAGLTALVILGAIDPTTLVGRALGTEMVANAGRRYSYAFYLWHYPVLVLVAPQVPGPLAARVLAGLGLTLAASWLTHHAVERPVQRLRRTTPAAG
jgi:peptidoglycan/LPS O-acetylase OafA/YrhL